MSYSEANIPAASQSMAMRSGDKSESRRDSPRKAHSPLRDSSHITRRDFDKSLLYLLREVFKEMMAIEHSLEDIKRDLAQRGDFTLAGAFNLFSGYSQARISHSDVVYGLERMGIQIDNDDATLLVSRYDSDGDGKLGFWEFSNIFMPNDNLIRDDLERRKAEWDISASTKELVRRVLRKVVDSEQMIESIR
jgi:hypothetical protein